MPFKIFQNEKLLDIEPTNKFTIKNNSTIYIYTEAISYFSWALSGLRRAE